MDINIVPNFRFTESSFVVDSKDYDGDFFTKPICALYNFGAREKKDNLDPAGFFLYKISSTFFQKLSQTEGLELLRKEAKVELDSITLESLLNSVPFALGSEFVDEQWIKNLWWALNDFYSKEIDAYDGTVALYLAEKSQHLKIAEKIFFHLVENKDDEEFPFAFLATYSKKNENEKISHLPLKFAINDFGDNNEKLLEFLSCLNKAGDVCPIIAKFIENGEMFYPLKLKSEEAFDILKAIPQIEESGIVCRIPDWWKKKKHSPSLTIKFGEEKKSLLGLQSIISTSAAIEIDGMSLSESEIKKLLQQTEGLAFIKGKWVEVNHEKLNSLLKKLKNFPAEISLLDALRQNLNFTDSETDDGKDSDEIFITNGKWLNSIFSNLRNPDLSKDLPVPKNLNAELRPYQKTGFSWLSSLCSLGFGACLADDMGLGKTIQVLSFLENMREKNPGAKNLLIVPASLLGNWENECKKFTPSIKSKIIHKKSKDTEIKFDTFLTITTYAIVQKIPEFKTTTWDALILDEAQAIKNPATKQTKNIKEINSKFRIALTGTPIENNLSNLWSIFDFLNTGLLGSKTEFSKFVNSLKTNSSGYSKLRNMISPFMLRRVKTDKKIISDLPEKNEIKNYIQLSKKQVVLYKKMVSELEKKLKENKENSIQRKGLVLSTILKLKQICNHPSQYLGEEIYDESDGAKFELLRELCETIYEKRERVLIFTQFKEIIPALDEFLCNVFGQKGFIIHGGTNVDKRTQIVQQFQSEKYFPYIILSLKAGGTGLTLTNANHVIHFDRWWNPAVENQATDRAFRIGQTKNVMVYKFICKGTVEEKIDLMIEEKKELAQNIIGASDEKWITEMSNDELMKILKLEN